MDDNMVFLRSRIGPRDYWVTPPVALRRVRRQLRLIEQSGVKIFRGCGMAEPRSGPPKREALVGPGAMA
jgi:hypothetical protein